MRCRAAIGVAAMLAGCGGAAPEGQVAARVDGIEITDRELLSEAAATGAGLTTPGSRAAVIDRLIDRKLLARAGKAALVERVPAVQIEMRRAREDVLARAYAGRVAADAAPPTTADIDRFMHENPHRFAARTSYLIDRLNVTGAVGATGAAGSAQAAAAALDRGATPYRRQLVLIDSDGLSAAANARLAVISPGQTLRVSNKDGVGIDTLILKRPVIETRDAQHARARAMLARSRTAAAVSAAVRGLRAGAEVAVRGGTVSR